MPNNLRLPAAVVAAAFAAGLAGAAPAHADSVVYVDRGNVVAASPDGAVKRALTTNGTEQESYRSPSADDQGRWLAARAGTWYWHAPDGALLSADLVDKGTCESLSTGPTAGRLDPTGDFVAFESMCSGFAGQGITSRVVINFPGRPTLGNAPVLEGFRQPTWMGNRLVADGGNGSFVQDATAEAPVSTAFTRWLPAPVRRVEVSRDRRRALVALNENGTEELWLARLDADPIGGLPTSACKVAVQGVPTRGGFSPDGGRIVWHDDRGVVVAPAYVPPPSGTERVEACTEQVAPGAPVVLSATGAEASFTPADLHAGGPAPGGPAPGGPAPGGPAPGGSVQPGGKGTTKPGAPEPGASARLAVRLPGGLKLAGLRRGIALPVRAPAAGAGRVTVTVGAKAAKTLRIGRSRTLAAARFTAAAAGERSVRVKPSRALAARLARLERLPVTITVAFTPTGGSRQQAQVKRTLR